MGSLAFPATMLKSCSALVLTVLVFCCSSLVLSVRRPQPRPYQFSYQVKDLRQGLHYAAVENSDGAQVRGEYKVLLPGTTHSTYSTYSTSSNNKHIKRATRQQAGAAHKANQWR